MEKIELVIKKMPSKTHFNNERKDAKDKQNSKLMVLNL